jgi:hypothetical protein
MSAWQIGNGNPVRGLVDSDGPGFKTYIDKLTKWIPGDILALYVAGITALKGASSTSKPSVVLLVAFAVLTPIVILLGAWKVQKFDAKLAAKVALGTFAFLVWALSIPFSGWQRLTAVADNAAAVAIIAAIVGLLYGLAADKLVGDS